MLKNLEVASCSVLMHASRRITKSQIRSVFSLPLRLQKGCQGSKVTTPATGHDRYFSYSHCGAKHSRKSFKANLPSSCRVPGNGSTLGEGS